MNSETYFVSPGTFGNGWPPSCGSADAASIPNELAKNSRRFMPGFLPIRNAGLSYKSEHQFQPKLNLAGTRGRARDLARRGTDAIARKDKEVRNAAVRPVRDVKAFGPEQQLCAFRD